jgi:hypothetical protein
MLDFYLKSGEYIMFYEDENKLIKKVGMHLTFPKNIKFFLKTEYGQLFALISKNLVLWLDNQKVVELKNEK